MSDGAVIRDLEPSDLQEIKQIHENSGLDYQFPDLQSPLFLVKKVLSIDGRVRMCVAGRLQLEAYLFMDRTDWADPEQKLVAIQELDRVATEEAREKGIDEIVLWTPPDMARWERRLFEDLGFSLDRANWHSYSKRI